ncbi:AcrB/AcrD/AcrF family protein [Idiomarina aquatica]|uniref:AcrB/AcrD/AcrF family protein n=1 Tax=Idiomarina aquatica TaxID=1327752 RepID=A0A4R6PRG3_9GAMM|nr:efflux RND transporter permease subunit [Idiomarina aquatica]TDP40707.1 AcrB/AcrD/AcrF family protein [Idiomarina aquatica]
MTETSILVNNALSQVPNYVDNVDQPRIFAASFSSNAFMYFRVAPLPDNPKNIDMVRMRDYIEDNVRPRMSSVAGVTVGRYDSLEQMQNTIIKRDGDRIVRLNDIAEIDLDHFETNSESWFKDEQVLSLQVKRESGSNVIDIKYAMLQEVERINEDLLKPAGMQIILNSDDVRYVEASISNVLFNLSLGAVFATLVMYGLMRSGRATMIAVIGIPICTLAGIAFAIGMTLDNTIVVLESIALERQKGADPKRAAVLGVQRVWTAVLASTLTTVMVFLPILFIVQEAGQFYSDIAIAISSAIIASMAVSVTLVPLLSGYISYSVSPSNMRIIAETRVPNRIEELMDAITTVYERYPGMRAFATKGSIISSNDAGFSHLNGYGYQ